MKHYLYILYSKKINKFYVGETPNIEIRLQQHRTHYFKTNFTKAANDWECKIAFECTNKEDALYLERFIKRMKSRKFIQKIVDNPSILEDLLSKK